MTPERCAEVERMIRAGYTLAATAREIGVTPATIYNNMGRDKIATLRAEAEEAREKDSSSHQQPATEEPGHLRAIK